MGLLLQYAGENEKKVLFEYMLALDLKVKRGEYADFIRAITPLGVDLLEIVLEQSCDIDITRYYKRIIKESGTKTDLSVKYWIF